MKTVKIVFSAFTLAKSFGVTVNFQVCPSKSEMAGRFNWEVSPINMSGIVDNGAVMKIGPVLVTVISSWYVFLSLPSSKVIVQVDSPTNPKLFRSGAILKVFVIPLNVYNETFGDTNILTISRSESVIVGRGYVNIYPSFTDIADKELSKTGRLFDYSSRLEILEFFPF